MKSTILRTGQSLAAAAVVVVATTVTAAAQVEIARQQSLVATVPSGAWCAPNVPVTINAPNRSSFRDGDWAFREIGGTIRRTMDEVCPVATHLNIIGRVDGTEVYNGRLGPDTGDRIVGSYVDGSGTVRSSPATTQPATSSPSPSYRDQVREAQTLLNRLGYNAGPADGLMGPRTRSAVRSFQRAHDLSVTGEVNQDLISALISAEG
ncbi:peptidoglycan-binding domain-containing protein [Fodinicurvata sp. EGI_FJ10296]|uniref:peptidoglycan-binding domain-containing protein n=1 Tax=Fodinicurvata sp. EGI_FJ10296 TaxID=3231908 RepID=UPI00345301F2